MQINPIKKKPQLNNLYKELENTLGGYLLDERIYKKANELIDKIYGIDSWIWHDIRNIVLFIYEYSIQLKENDPEDDKSEIQNHIKQQFKKLNELIYWKEYNTTEIMKDILDISKKLNINIDLHFFNNIIWTIWDGLYKDIKINYWEIVDVDERLILRDSTNNIKTSFITKLFNLFSDKKTYNKENLELKNYFWKFNAPLYRILINTITNAQQAWATKIDVYVSYLAWTERLILKIVDNWQWMDEHIIKNILFQKWESTKKESWINYWVWMHEIAKLVWSYNWEIEVYSKQWNTKLQALYPNNNLISNNNNIKPINKNFILWKIYNTYIKSENWSEFVFKLSVYNK